MVKDPKEHPDWFEEVIRRAKDDGEFDDLPGAGKPIPGAGTKDDDLWWVRSWIRRNNQKDED